MSTTNMYQGLQSDKSSSRVLKPPGGGCSNIFGTDPEPTKSNQPSRARAPPSNNIFGPADAQEPKRKPRDNSASNIFGSPDAAESPKVDESPRRKQVEDEVQNEMASVEPEVSPVPEAKHEDEGLSPAQSAQVYAKRMQQVGINPITGLPCGSGCSGDDEDTDKKPGTGNPITGEANENIPAPVNRVRQPPGGASSKLW